LEPFELEKPLTLQLGCVGSKSKINHGVNTRIHAAGRDVTTYLDIINIDHYDVILGTPFMAQNGVVLDFERREIRIGNMTLPCVSVGEERAMRAKRGKETHPQRLRDDWMYRIQDLTQPVPLELLPLRAINHKIPLIDENKTHRYHLPCCAEALKPQLLEKLQRYIQAGWWERKAVTEAAPLMCIPK
ncbi:hypothetical protein BC834DRAFT_788099, partial [Gloeopeniophorella convolvens]